MRAARARARPTWPPIWIGCPTRRADRDPRLVALLAARQHRRGRSPARRRPAQQPGAARQRCASRSNGSTPPASRRRRRDAAGGPARQPGAHGAPDRGPPQDGARHAARDRRAARATATARSCDDGERATWERTLRRQVLTLWQTAMLRLSRLRVRDEINEALGYYELSLLEQVPALHRALADELARRWPDRHARRAARPAHGLVDRGRPRRQSVRHRRRAAVRDRAPGKRRARPSPRSARSPDDRAVDVHPSGRAQRGAARARGGIG